MTVPEYISAKDLAQLLNVGLPRAFQLMADTRGVIRVPSQTKGRVRKVRRMPRNVFGRLVEQRSKQAQVQVWQQYKAATAKEVAESA